MIERILLAAVAFGAALAVLNRDRWLPRSGTQRSWVTVALGLTATIAFGLSRLQMQSSTRILGFRLFSQLVSNSAAKNVVISPVSIEMCLAMAANGAGGKTLTEMAGVLGTPAAELYEVNRANAAMLRTLADSGSPAKLAIANSVWGRTGLKFNQRFLDVCSRDYSAGARTLDFTSPTAVREINGWVADRTHGLIPTIIDALGPNDVALLLNAVYFRCKYARPFDPELTSAKPFYLMDGSQVERQMMMQKGEFRFLKTSGFSAVALPFADDRFSMYVFVPHDRDGLPGFLRKASESSWRQWMSDFGTQRVRVGLPRFSVEYQTSLKASLMAMGMTTAFDSAHADFTTMVAESPLQPVWLGDAMHKVFIEATEEGVRAAAATGVVVFGGPIQIETVVADHPFFFAITDETFGAILFMGAVYDPPQ